MAGQWSVVSAGDRGAEAVATVSAVVVAIRVVEAAGGVADGLLGVGVLAEAIGDDAILFVDATLHLGLAAAGGDRERNRSEQGRGDLDRTLHAVARVAGGRGKEWGIGSRKRVGQWLTCVVGVPG